MVSQNRTLATLLALAKVATSMPALGQVSSDDSKSVVVSPHGTAETAVVEARRAFREGVNHARARHFRAAVTAFEVSLALHPHAATLWNLATSELGLGKLSAARIHFQEALRRATRDPNELDASKRAAAEQRLLELDRRIERTTTSNNSPVTTTTTTTNASQHATTPSGPSRRIVAADEGTYRVPTRPVSENNVASPLQLPAFGLAAAGAVSAVIFGVLAVNEATALDRTCPDRSRCPTGSNERRAALTRHAMLTDISLVFTLVAAGTGLYVTLVPPSSARHSVGGRVVVTRTF